MSGGKTLTCFSAGTLKGQGAGLGYLIERGAALGRSGSNGTDRNFDSSANGKTPAPEIDMARLLGRVPTIGTRMKADSTMDQLFKKDDGAEKMDVENPSSGRGKDNSRGSDQWKGSGLGSEWDGRVGAGAAVASIVSLCFAKMKCIEFERDFSSKPSLSYYRSEDSFSQVGRL